MGRTAKIIPGSHVVRRAHPRRGIEFVWAHASHWPSGGRQFAAVAAIFVLLVTATPVRADFREWTSSTEATYWNGGYTTRTPGDTWRARTTMVWNSTRASNMRHMASHGYKFSQDVHDQSCNLNATSQWASNLPNPYFDLDLGCTYQAVEAEVTSESGAFPTAFTTYYTHFYWMRWYKQFGVWKWDPDGGRLLYGESLSEQYPIGDKWDTTDDFGNNCCTTLRLLDYPYTPQPSGFTAEDTEPPGSRPIAATSTGPEPSLFEDFSLIATGDDGELIIKPSMGGGLDAYAHSARGLASRVIRSGPAHGIVTFERPVGEATLVALSELGVKIVTYEATSSQAGDGSRLTVGDVYHPGYSQSFAALEADHGVTQMGVTSAEVVVPNATVLQAAFNMPDVWLIDLSLEQVGRAHPELTDVVMNDLYWKLAGWEGD